MNGSRKILIVEDSPMMCQLYRMVLGRLDATELLFAGNGLEGLDRVAQEPDIDLMIVDINMPLMDGLEFLRRVKEVLGDVSVPAIVISTESGESDRSAAFSAGARAYLSKPWRPEDLIRQVDELLPRTPA